MNILWISLHSLEDFNDTLGNTKDFLVNDNSWIENISLELVLNVQDKYRNWKPEPKSYKFSSTKQARPRSFALLPWYRNQEWVAWIVITLKIWWYFIYQKAKCSFSIWKQNYRWKWFIEDKWFRGYLPLVRGGGYLAI